MFCVVGTKMLQREEARRKGQEKRSIPLAGRIRQVSFAVCVTSPQPWRSTMPLIAWEFAGYQYETRSTLMMKEETVLIPG
jgi:hypothetical protein